MNGLLWVTQCPLSDLGAALAPMSPRTLSYTVVTVRDREHVTDDEIVVEGRMCGTHVGEFQGFAPTNRDVELPFVAFYRFDEGEKLTSERVVMDLSSLLVRDS